MNTYEKSSSDDSGKHQQERYSTLLFHPRPSTPDTRALSPRAAAALSAARRVDLRGLQIHFSRHEPNRERFSSLKAGSSRSKRRSAAPGGGRRAQANWKGLIRDYVREEVFAREAVALGLDKDDTIIRRRLRQKLEFVSEDVAAQAEPTDEQLHAYLKEHPDTFRGDRRFSFSQVYLDPQRRGANLRRDAAQVLAQLGRPGSKVDLQRSATRSCSKTSSRRCRRAKW